MSRSLRLGLILVPLSAALGVGGWFLYQRSQEHTQPGGPDGTGPDAAKHAGKLVVLVVFDQMRGDYLARWADQFGPDGFERMKKGGVWYSDCHLPYACSSTGPGHASIATGAPPAVHGIIENEWYDRAAAARVYCVQPNRPYELVPALPPDAAGKPTRGADTGFAPDQLLAETVGDRFQAATGGKGRVVSLSIKDRTAVLMGGKKPTAAYCFDTRDGLFHTGGYYRDAVHPWAAAVNASRKVDGWAGKEWDRFRPDLDYDKLAGRDDAPGEGYGYGQKRVFPHPFPALTAEPDKRKQYYNAVETSPAGNELLFELVKAAVAGENLGTGDGPDLLCVSFSSNDLIGHFWGPDSWEVLDITLRADKVIADFLRFLDEKVGEGRYVMAITADHGVCPIPEQKRYPELYPAATRKSVRGDLLPGLTAALEETYGKAPAGPTRWLEVADKEAEQVWPWVYLNHAAIKARGLDPTDVAGYAAQWIGNRPYMLTGITRGQIEADHLPPVGPGAEKEVRAVFEEAKRAYHPARCGDVLAVQKPGVQISPYPEGTGHGSPHAYDTHVPVLVYGAGVPAVGKQERRVSSLIVAPTLAWALGVDPPAGAVEKVPGEIREGK
ncbi:MAG: phoV 2 [Gemmataceae bacterium]|nr:phoV 2 [Gemmataceae bacterium]